MTSNILTVAAVILIVAGGTGLLGKSIKGRLIGITAEVIGMLLLTNCQGTDYGFFAGTQMLLFQLPAFLLFSIGMVILCRKNHMTSLEDLQGVAQNMPYGYLLLVISGLFVFGCPGTGTFSAYMLMIASLIVGFVRAFDIVGLCGLVAGILFLSVLLIDIYRRMLLREVQREEETAFLPVSRIFMAAGLVILAALCVLSVYQTPVIGVITKAYGALKM